MQNTLLANHPDEEDHKHPTHESQAGVLLVQLEAFKMQRVMFTDILLCGGRTDCLYLYLCTYMYLYLDLYLYLSLYLYLYF